MDYQREIGYVPNGYVCELCPDWDDVNGCWAGFNNWTECPFDEDEYLDEMYGPEDEWSWEQRDATDSD